MSGDILHEVKVEQGTVYVPFDVDEVVDNLRCQSCKFIISPK